LSDCIRSRGEEMQAIEREAGCRLLPPPPPKKHMQILQIILAIIRKKYL